MKNPKLYVHEPVQTLPELHTLDVYDHFVFGDELYTVMGRPDDTGIPAIIKVLCLTNPTVCWFAESLPVRPVTITYMEVTPV